MNWLADVETRITQSDLIGASRVLDTNRAIQSGRPQAFIACSRLMQLRGRLHDAQDMLDRALDVEPGNVAALIERGRLSVRIGDDADACTWFQRVGYTHMHGDSWLIDWFDASLRCSRVDDATDIALVLCRHFTADAGNWFRLGLVHQAARRHADALDAYEKAAQTNPRLPMLRNNWGAAYLELGRHDEALKLFETTIAEEPDNALAWTNLASVLLRTGNIDDSLVAAERACTLAPQYITALQTYSYVLREHGRFGAALEVAQNALSLEPTNPSLIWTVAMLQLLRGDYDNGWRNHEARWAGSPELRDVSPNIPAPLWNGEPLAGKTIFLWGEQGHGDALQFVRFVPAFSQYVKQQGGKLVYCCFDTLHALFARSLGDAVETIIPHDRRPLPMFDCHLPIGSLPFVLGVRLDELPGGPYLKADHAKVADWRKTLAESRNLRVGIAWSGSKAHQRNRLRSVNPMDYAHALAGMRDVTFVNLQMDAHDDVLRLQHAGMRLVDPTPELSSFDDTASLIDSLDLVITVCTSIAHLAGGLGVPTWVLLDANPHWIWMTQREDSPWYRNTRLYRQSGYGAWAPVFEALARDLAVLAFNHTACDGHADVTTNTTGSIH
ncbi:tetratricopeptide repeat protein [Burkholderia vietnamiensis]|uniref:tetratricopeptide repeat protein n=1 Tax=Burkholderia vietnamiensis TaxID=60552 RepID=UPI00159327C0|nr:tetratricopeptide repeat protein [Burkholderia vietnamiensis]WHU95792.1 tetratricopeptide repeat protein [Burkholderia vietnamiensis]CAG9200620.1 Tetratricopeptide TPR_2 repeat protein [Burkholderia vietnamiensis]HDR9055962.1 tetratricopeptide repeat protein [Burkholderia vietnamiensis]HDR9157058.1 tetratricopeptide repeat protein [Burkholderia vietnamiensis]